MILLDSSDRLVGENIVGQKEFESEIPLEHLDALLDLGLQYGFDPTSSLEMERYLTTLLKDHAGSISTVGVSRALHPVIESAFRCVGSSPDWIQNPDWLIDSGRPMWFLGQLEIPADKGLFHDDAAVYVFLNSETGVVRGVTQIA